MHKVMISLVCILSVSCFCYATDDNQEYWAVTSFSFRLDGNWTMKIKEDFRFRDGESSEQQHDLLFTYKGISDALDLGLGFRQVYKEDSSHEWQRESRPYVQLTLKNTLLGLKWSDRNLFEYRDFENKKDAFRYRNRLKLSSPHNLFDLPLKPYVADEVFFQEESGYNRNRIYAGLVWDVNKLLDIDFFFIRQKDKTSRGWDNVYIAGFETIFSF